MANLLQFLFSFSQTLPMNRFLVKRKSYLRSQSSNTETEYSTENDYDYYEMECCPLVVDPLIVLALISFIALATYLLQTVIDMSMLGKRKKRSFSGDLIDICVEGKKVNKQLIGERLSKM